MSIPNQQINALAERVAASHQLEVVGLELQGGGGTHRTLRIFLERDAEGRAELERRLEAVRSADAPQPIENGTIVLDLVEAGETAGLSEEEDELAYLRDLPPGVPVAQLSGVTHGDCERFSRDFGTALDVEDLLGGAEYLLEVSSPGLDRKLTKREEFVRFTGQLCKLQLHEAIAGNRHWQGHLGPLEGDSLTLIPLAMKKGKGKKKATAEPGGEPVMIALSNVEKAQLVPEF